MIEQLNFIQNQENEERKRMQEERDRIEKEKENFRKKMREKYDLLELEDLNEFQERLNELGIGRRILLNAINEHIKKSKIDGRGVYLSPKTPLGIMSIDLASVFNVLDKSQKEKLEEIINDVFIKKGFVLEEDTIPKERRPEEPPKIKDTRIGIERSLPREDD